MRSGDWNRIARSTNCLREVIPVLKDFTTHIVDVTNAFYLRSRLYGLKGFHQSVIYRELPRSARFHFRW